jgi:flagellar protein FliO/FliZ
MWDIIYYLAIVLFLAVAMIGGAYVARAYLGGTGPFQAMSGLFGPKPDKRLAISEQYNIDAKRRLVLIRRDDVEHLILTGGPVDVVVETGIRAPYPAPLDQENAPTLPGHGSLRV